MIKTGQTLPLVGFGVLLLSALLTAIYMFQIVLRAWFPRHGLGVFPVEQAHEARWEMTVPMVLLALLCLVMGLFPQPLLDLIREAVTTL